MRTPKTLLESVVNGLNKAELEEGSIALDTKKAVKDFIAQHFTVAIGKNPEQEQILMDLFKRITE